MDLRTHIIEHEILGISSGDSAASSESVVITIACDSSVSGRDLVRYSDTVHKTVVSCLDNRNILPAIGVVVTKITSTLCMVQIEGPCDLVFTGLEYGKKVYLGVDGEFTTIKPTTGYMQVLGICNDDGTVHLYGTMHRVKTNPF